MKHFPVNTVRHPVRDRLQQVLLLQFMMMASGLLSIVHCRASEPSPLASSAQIPNVLFIVSDDLRANVLGCYGNSICRIPNIDRLVRRGLVFERAYCHGTWCAPLCLPVIMATTSVTTRFR
ncbi:MAG: sulfatase-like hydrolase/transferase [Planctomycetaceae bacterium]